MHLRERHRHINRQSPIPEFSSVYSSDSAGMSFGQNASVCSSVYASDNASWSASVYSYDSANDQL